MAMTVPIFYVPFLAKVFHVHALNLTDWIVSALSASTIFIAAEIYKLIISLLRSKDLIPKSDG
jgi:hypothetical protein